MIADTKKPIDQKWYKLKKPDLIEILVILSILSIVYLIVTPKQNWPIGKAQEAETKANLHTIQIVLERYATDADGTYPESINMLIEQEFLLEFPMNAFKRDPFESMNNIPFGSEPYEGEFTYISVTEESVVIGYYLLAYGLEQTVGHDVDGDGEPDHVILVLSGSSEEIDLDEEYPLEELLGNGL